MSRVAVVVGGPSREAAVSRESGRGVAGALSKAGHTAELVELDAAAPGRLVADHFDVVFPACHGPLGEDGCLQGVLEVLGLPYVGSGVLACAVAMSKPAAKAAFRQAGLPLAKESVVGPEEEGAAAAARVLRELGNAGLVVKPANGGSAIGVQRLTGVVQAEALRHAILAARGTDPSVLVEVLHPGSEVTCGVLGDERGGARALSPTLVVPKASSWYDFTTRYTQGAADHLCPAPLEPAVLERIQQVALAAHRALGARDLSRSDFVVDAERGPDGVILLELNASPGMTPTSLFPEAAAVAGLDFPALCDHLVRCALARPKRAALEEVPFPD